MAEDERGHEHEPESEPRLFNRQEAEDLLPLLANLLTSARESKKRVDEVDSEFSQMQNRILLYGGIMPPYGQLAQKKLERDGLVSAIRKVVTSIEQNGCVLKDLEEGLVDFPSIVNEEQVFLCWKLGEERILYWHRQEEGFAGRKPLSGSDAAPPGPAKPN